MTNIVFCFVFLFLDYFIDVLAPDPVSDITVRTQTSRSLMLFWIQPCHPNGIIINYRIKIQNYNDSIDNQGRFTNNNNTLNTNNNSTSFNVTYLLPYRSYVFTVYTEVDGVENLSEPAVSKPFQTDTEGLYIYTIYYDYNLLIFTFFLHVSFYKFIYVSSAPYPPVEISFSSITSSSVQVRWEHPNIQTGPTRYEVVATDKTDSSVKKSCYTQGLIILYLCAVNFVSVEIYII